jgi:hypothetical protein
MLWAGARFTALPVAQRAKEMAIRVRPIFKEFGLEVEPILPGL